MRKSFTASIIISAVLLAGCTDSSKDTTSIIKSDNETENYQLSNKFIMNHVEYKDLNQYNEQREKDISQEIAQYIEKEGFSEDGYDAEGYDRRGFNRNGIAQNGFGTDGFNLKGINEQQSHRDASPSSFRAPYNKYGYNSSGYDEEGYDQYGYNAQGYSIDGFNKLGYSINPDEVSMNDYKKRNWETIAIEEVFRHDMYYPAIDDLMKNNAQLKADYYSQSVHPYSKEAYYINLICNSTPAIFDDILPSLRVETVSKLKVEHSSNRDILFELESNNGDFLQLIDDVKFVPTPLLSQLKHLEQLKVNENITLENNEGIVTDFKLVSKNQLPKEAQHYIDFARLAMSESKGKWANTSLRFDEIVYKAMDQQYEEMQLNEVVFGELESERQKTWPKNYLTDSNEKIERFNKEQREVFIDRIMQDIQTYEQSENNK